MKRNEKPMKERILEEALQLFSQNGYTGTSMNDIAAKLGVTKAALYKHYKSKQEILDSIVEKASEYGLPEEQQGEDFLSERQVSYDDIKTYTKEQFSYWTSEEFPSCFRRVLTLEQYRDPRMANLYQRYLAKGPVSYMEPIFEQLTQDNSYWTFTDRFFCFTVFMTEQRRRRVWWIFWIVMWTVFPRYFSRKQPQQNNVRRICFV